MVQFVDMQLKGLPKLTEDTTEAELSRDFFDKIDLKKKKRSGYLSTLFFCTHSQNLAGTHTHVQSTIDPKDIIIPIGRYFRFGYSCRSPVRQVLVSSP